MSECWSRHFRVKTKVEKMKASLFRPHPAPSASRSRPLNSIASRCIPAYIALAARGGTVSAEALNCGTEGEKKSVDRFLSPAAATTSSSSTSTSQKRRLASGLLASALAVLSVVVVVVASPLMMFPGAAVSKDMLDEDPVSFFQLRGSVAKKYAIEELEESGASPSSSSPSSSSHSSPSSRVVKRKSGLTVAACVAEGRGPRGGELSAALASPSGAAAAPPPTACGRAEDASRANLPRACASACSAACSAAVERKNELLRSTTGFSLGESAARRLGRSCTRACAGECVRPSTSSARAYDFFVNFGR